MFNKEYDRLSACLYLLNNIYTVRCTQTWRTKDEVAAYRAAIRLLEQAMAKSRDDLESIYLFDLKHTYAPPIGMPRRGNLPLLK